MMNKIFITLIFFLFFIINNNFSLFQRQNYIEDINGQIDSIFFINNTKVVQKNIKKCSLKSVDKDDEDFLNMNIKYYSIEKIDKNQLTQEKYYRNFLIDTKFLQFNKNDFDAKNYKFILNEKIIKDYGHCYVAKFYFPYGDNSSQRRSIVIINYDKKELSIWNFEDLIITKDGVECEFSIRGKKVNYDLIYSPECDSFL